MLGKGLFAFLVIFAFAFPSVAAKKKGGRSCSNIKNCGKCLNKIQKGCVWHIGPDYQGSCMESTECDSLEGECYEGSQKKEANRRVCGDTCGTQTALGCTECLSFGAMGKTREKPKSDCAWFVQFGQEPQCMHRKRCKEPNNREGKCITGTRDDSQVADQCAAEVRLQNLDICEGHQFCGGCLSSDACAWYENGSASRCIAKPRCDDRGFEGGTCTPADTTFDIERTCAAIVSGLKPSQHFHIDKPIVIDPDESPGDWTKPIVIDPDEKPDPEDPVIELPIVIEDPEEPIVIVDPIVEIPVRPDPEDPDEVGFEKCSDFDGLCTDCLNWGCSWINAFQGCVDSCREAPADVGCDALPPQANRKLLQFEDEASQMCYNFKLENKNNDLCVKAGSGGCRKCVQTQIFTSPSEYYIVPPTCQWFPETETCFPFGNGMMGRGTDKCEDDRVGIYEPMPGPNMSWPKLVGEPYEFAEDYFSGTYGPELEIERIPEGMFVIENYVVTRVRLYVDGTDIVVQVPRVG